MHKPLKALLIVLGVGALLVCAVVALFVFADEAGVSTTTGGQALVSNTAPPRLLPARNPARSG